MVYLVEVAAEQELQEMARLEALETWVGIPQLKVMQAEIQMD
jgi:hypothetical protein